MDGLAQGRIDAARLHGLMCRCTAFEISAECRENEVLVAMVGPVLAQEIQGGVGQWHIAVFGTLPTVYVDHHACAVYVGDLKVQCLTEAQTARVDSGKIHIIVKGAHPIEYV